MRADLAPLATSALYLFAGFGVLGAAGALRLRLWSLLAAAGLAYLAGMAAVLLVGIALMSAGVALGLGSVTAITIAIGVGGLALWRIRGEPADTRPPRAATGAAAELRAAIRSWGPEHWIAAAIVAALVVYLAAGYAAASRETIFGWDSFSIWSRKALLLLHAGKPDAAIFGSNYYTFMNPDYPILLPFAESIFFRVSGTTDFQALHGQFWILFAAFLWAAGYLASRVGRPLLWAPLIALLAVTPGLEVGIRTMYADVPMSLFLGIGVLLVGMWITDRRPGDLALGTLMLAAAASTKNEGLAAAAGVLVVALLVRVIARDGGSVRSAAAAPLAALAALGVAVAPWRLWVGAHDVPTVTIPVSKGFDPGFVIGHADRFHPTVTAIGSEVADPGKWYYLLPLALAMAIAALLHLSGRALPRNAIIRRR
jgi:hypothetical protein